MRRVRMTIVAVHKQEVLYIPSLCFVALVIQHANRMRRFILPSVACPGVPYFFHFLKNCKIFGEKFLNIKCVFLVSLQILPETFPFL
jgi:hypothetical protein